MSNSFENEYVVILAGGLGTRLREETEYKPKPLVQIGNLPIIVHLMLYYSGYGLKKFIVCLGYKGEMLKEYFLNFKYLANDFKLSFKSDKIELLNGFNNMSLDWEILFLDTGLNSNTGKRIALTEKHIDSDYFMVTYGDTLSDVDLISLAEYHKKMKTIGVLTGVLPHSKYGTMIYEPPGIVTQFQEKPLLQDYVNGGFYRFSKDLFDFLDVNKNQIFEIDVLPELAAKRQLAVYGHRGFWFAMDTYKDYIEINEMWNKNYKPWLKKL
ncbi:MAG: sugar phosphate nucleotidyltransferase [Candidatus Anstonellales archaeon]